MWLYSFTSSYNSESASSPNLIQTRKNKEDVETGQTETKQTVNLQTNTY